MFSLTAIFPLAIGIAATTTIYGRTDALLFAPTVGVRDALRVVDIGRSTDGSGVDNMSQNA